MTRSILWAAAALTAFGLAACDKSKPSAQNEKPAGASREAPYRTVTRLNCPQTQGELKLITAAPDGSNCAYTGADGAEVTLQLLANEAALGPIEAELRTLIPPPVSRAAKPVVEVSASDGKAGNEGDAHIRLPGLSIDAQDGRAQINLGGMHIDANDDSTDVSISKRDGDVKISADNDGAEIRDGDVDARGVRRTLILARNEPTTAGYRLAGYEARGPRAGPLVTAVIRAKGGGEADYMFKDVRALVAHNTGK